MSASVPLVAVRWPQLVAVLQCAHAAAGLGDAAALSRARCDALRLARALALPGHAGVSSALNGLAAAVEALAAERDSYRQSWLRLMDATHEARNATAALTAENAALHGRIARAVAELDAAPDADPDKPSKRQVKALADANTRAWAVLCEGRDPPGKRRAEDAPRHPGDGT